MCGFVQDSNDDFNWTRHMADTPSSSTGPSADHTTRNGMKMLHSLRLPPSPILITESDVFFFFLRWLFKPKGEDPRIDRWGNRNTSILKKLHVIIYNT